MATDDAFPEAFREGAGRRNSHGNLVAVSPPSWIENETVTRVPPRAHTPGLCSSDRPIGEWPVFLLATAGLAGTVETVEPGVARPRVRSSIRQIEKWKENADRPLLVAFGSFRTQNRLCPAAMDFPDEPGSPVVYNFGYRAARPTRAWFQLMRLLDTNLKPDLVLMQISMADLLGSPNEEFLPPQWGDRLAADDLKRAAPYLADSGPLFRRGFRLDWSVGPRSRGDPQRCASEWQPSIQRLNYYWERNGTSIASALTTRSF